jgi:hypothetical protein
VPTGTTRSPLTRTGVCGSSGPRSFDRRPGLGGRAHCHPARAAASLLGGQQSQPSALGQMSNAWAPRPGKSRRSRASDSKWQISVTASDGTTNRVQFSPRNLTHRAWSRSALLNAATSGPVSHKIMPLRPRQLRHDPHTSGTYRGSGLGPPALQGPDQRGQSRSTLSLGRLIIRGHVAAHTRSVVGRVGRMPETHSANEGNTGRSSKCRISVKTGAQRVAWQVAQSRTR